MTIVLSSFIGSHCMQDKERLIEKLDKEKTELKRLPQNLYTIGCC